MDDNLDRIRSRRAFVRPLLAWLVLSASALAQQPPPDAAWTANAALDVERSTTDLGLGAVQGVVVRDGKIYAYGDVFNAEPRVGVIREYNMELQATGRVVWLRRGGKPLIIHPTGLTWNDRWGTFLGDTVKSPADPARSRAIIYRLDWERAWKDGDLENAVLAVIADDAAVNGCRPEFVTVGGQTLLATADYGDVRPEIRLYDPDSLLAAARSSAPGVVKYRVLCGPFNQNLSWNAKSRQLTCVQNVIAGRGWQLDVLNLNRAVADGRDEGPGVRVQRLTFSSHDELEGYWPLDGKRALFAIARRRDNLVMASSHETTPRISPPEKAPAEAQPAPGSARPARTP